LLAQGIGGPDTAAYRRGSSEPLPIGIAHFFPGQRNVSLAWKNNYLRQRNDYLRQINDLTSWEKARQSRPAARPAPRKALLTRMVARLPEPGHRRLGRLPYLGAPGPLPAGCKLRFAGINTGGLPAGPAENRSMTPFQQQDNFAGMRGITAVKKGFQAAATTYFQSFS